MADGEVLVSSGDESEKGDEILKGLPAWMPRSPSDGNFKLLDVVGRAFDRLGDDIRDADDAVNIQTAQSIEQVDELASVVDIKRKENSSLGKYRRRAIGEFQATTAEGTIRDLMNNVSTLLEIETRKIGHNQGTESGAFLLSVPGNAIDNVALTTEEFSEILNKQTAAGFRADIQSRGTFTYITPTQYNNNDHDPSKGYDGLDANDDPKDNGGTYAGLLS